MKRFADDTLLFATILYIEVTTDKNSQRFVKEVLSLIFNI